MKKKNSTTQATPLIDAQSRLFEATKEFKLSISGFEKAQERMVVAEQEYTSAKSVLANEVNAVKELTKVIPLSSR